MGGVLGVPSWKVSWEWRGMEGMSVHSAREGGLSSLLTLLLGRCVGQVLRSPLLLPSMVVAASGRRCVFESWMDWMDSDADGVGFGGGLLNECRLLSGQPLKYEFFRNTMDNHHQEAAFQGKAGGRTKE